MSRHSVQAKPRLAKKKEKEERSLKRNFLFIFSLQSNVLAK
jgi:hypothetical protein